MNKIFRVTTFCFVAIGFFLVTSLAHAANITCSAMVADNSTDNTSALNACIAQAQNQPEKTVIIPTGGTYRFSGAFSIPEGITIRGGSSDRNATTVRAEFWMSSNSTVEYLTFANIANPIRIGWSNTDYINNATVQYNKFNEHSWAVILMVKANDCVIDNNIIMNRKPRLGDNNYSNIQLLGGKRNKITNNHIEKGLTCIIALYDRRENGGGYESLIEDTLVDNNYCFDWLEEGISFDVLGNQRGGVASLEYDTISSVSGSTVTLSSGLWSSAGNNVHVGYDMVFMGPATHNPNDNRLHGQTRRIVSSSGAVFTLDSPVQGAAPGEQIVIGATFKNNVVTNNYAVTGGWDAILFYGMSFNNVIENNEAKHIGVRAIDNTVPADISVTSTWGRNPCGHNLIRNNTIHRNAFLAYYDLPHYNGPFSQHNHYSYGNTVINNSIGQEFQAYHQYAHIDNNTGPWKERFSNVTKISLSLQATPQPPKNFLIDLTVHP